MRVFKTRWFERFAAHQRIADSALRNAIARAERGLIDADLGGGLIKLRIPRPGQGRSGRYRTIIAYHAGNKAFFLHGFAKSVQGNIGDEELATLKKYGKVLLSADLSTIDAMLGDGSLQEVDNGKET